MTWLMLRRLAMSNYRTHVMDGALWIFDGNTAVCTLAEAAEAYKARKNESEDKQNDTN